jgi:RHS repeat-associated protein
MDMITDASEVEADAHRLNYQYDGRGVRVITAESRSDGTWASRYSTYSPELQLLSISWWDGENVWGSRVRTNADIPSSKHDFVWFGGRPLVQFSSTLPTGAHWYFTDHLGTPFLQTDTTGSVAWRVEYEPYGDIWTTRVPDDSSESTTPSFEQPLRFPGQEAAMRWEGTEERYNLFRWYRTGFGRYTQADPVGLNGGVNLYQYTRSNPTTWTDRFGLTTGDCQEHADRCSAIEKQIKSVSKKLKRLLDNELDPRSYAPSAFDYWDRYGGHLEQYANRQRELDRLRKRWNDERCDGDPPNYFGMAEQPYPEFDWDEFRRFWRDGAKRSMGEINRFMNDPRTWLGLGAAASGGGRVPVGAFP